MEGLTSAFSTGAGGSGQRDQLWPMGTPGIVWRRCTNKSPHGVSIMTVPHCQDSTSFPPIGKGTSCHSGHGGTNPEPFLFTFSPPPEDSQSIPGRGHPILDNDRILKWSEEEGCPYEESTNCT